MDYKTTSTKTSSPRGRSGGFALTEMIFAAGITTLLVLVVCSFSMYSGRSFAVMANYVDLDDANRLAVDRLTRDVRQANRVVSTSTNSLILEDSDGFTIAYVYSPSTRKLTRTKSSLTKVILTECDTLRFSLGQRNPVGASYDIYPAASPATAKVVNVAWVCSRQILGVRANTESVQTARIVIRKQGT